MKVIQGLLVDGRDRWEVRTLEDANGGAPRVAIYRGVTDWQGKGSCEYIGFYRGKPTVLKAGPDGSVDQSTLPQVDRVSR